MYLWHRRSRGGVSFHAYGHTPPVRRSFINDVLKGVPEAEGAECPKNKTQNKHGGINAAIPARIWAGIAASVFFALLYQHFCNFIDVAAAERDDQIARSYVFPKIVRDFFKAVKPYASVDFGGKVPGVDVIGVFFA